MKARDEAHRLIRQVESGLQFGPLSPYASALRDLLLELDRVEAERDALHVRKQMVRAVLHSLPQATLDLVAAKCRETPCSCFCGCHVSQVDELDKEPT